MNATSSSISWRQVWGLAIMLSSVTLGFAIYNIFQPQLLEAIGFPNLATSLGIGQGILGAFVEPAVGNLSDQIIARWGSRLPQITVGVTVASLVFIVTAMLVPLQLAPNLQWLFLLLMFIWVMAMIAIRGPIIAILRQIAPISQLPIANTVVILSIGLVGAISPLLSELLKSWGSSISLILGAIFLVLGAAVLHNNQTPHCAQASNNIRQRGWVICSLMLLIGCGTGIEVNCALQLIPGFLHQQWHQLSVGTIAALLLAIAAISGVGLGKLCQNWGAARSMQVGLIFLVLIISLHTQTWGSGLLWLGCGVAIGLIFISAAPVALSYFGGQQAGLSTGLFFGGGGLGSSIVQYLVQFHSLNLNNAGVLLLVTLVLTCVGLQFLLGLPTDENF